MLGLCVSGPQRACQVRGRRGPSRRGALAPVGSVEGRRRLEGARQAAGLLLGLSGEPFVVWPGPGRWKEGNGPGTGVPAGVRGGQRCGS
jgi:hypothetical protein